MIDIDGPVWTPEAPPGLLEFLAFTPQPVPLLPVVAAVLLALYLAGLIRLRALGRAWPLHRTILFVSGCVLLAAVTGLGVEGYGLAMFSVFMFQQLTLMILIPPLLVLGAPGTLFLRATPRRGVGRVLLRGALRVRSSIPARVALHPAIGIGLFVLAFYGLYLSGLANQLLDSLAGHLALEVGFLALGVLFVLPILSPDPLPVRQSYLARMLDVFVEMALHAFFGVFLMMSVTPIIDTFKNPPPQWGIDPLADQQIAGGLAWSYGEAPTVLILLYLVHRWYRDDTRKAQRADRHADASGDPDLDEYNRYLQRLRDSGGDG